MARERTNLTKQAMKYWEGGELVDPVSLGIGFQREFEAATLKNKCQFEILSQDRRRLKVYMEAM